MMKAMRLAKNPGILPKPRKSSILLILSSNFHDSFSHRPLTTTASRTCPDMHRPIIVSRGDTRAIMRPRHRFHKIEQGDSMTAIGEEVVSSNSMPHLYGPIG